MAPGDEDGGQQVVDDAGMAEEQDDGPGCHMLVALDREPEAEYGPGGGKHRCRPPALYGVGRRHQWRAQGTEATENPRCSEGQHSGRLGRQVDPADCRQPYRHPRLPAAKAAKRVHHHRPDEQNRERQGCQGERHEQSGNGDDPAADFCGSGLVGGDRHTEMVEVGSRQFPARGEGLTSFRWVRGG